MTRARPPLQLWKWLPWAATLALAACEPAPGPQTRLELRLTRGDANPLVDPGDATRVSAPVGSLQLKLITPEQTLTRVVPVDSGAHPNVTLTPPNATEARVVIRGLRSTDGALYSAGRSVSFALGANQPESTGLFFGPVEAFTAVGSAMPGPRQGARAVPLGNGGALVVGGFDRSTGQTVLAAPSLVRYDLAGTQVCGPTEGCITGELPPPRRDGIAVALSDGSVLHGLGREASGSCSDAVFLTTPDGATTRLTLGGSPPLPGLCGAAAVALADGAVLVLGGDTGTQPQTGVWRIDVVGRAALPQPIFLSQPRTLAGAAVLSGGEVLVVGGQGPSGGLDSAELYISGQASQAIDGDAFAFVRSKLRGPRVAPELVRLADNGVLVWGGGPGNGEVFQLELGNHVGGFADLVAPPVGLDVGAAALLRLKDGTVLMVGGEPAGASAAQAALFTPTTGQTVNSTSPLYLGTWRRVGAASTLRARPAIALLADESVLLVGGGTLGEGTTGACPSAPRAEVYVTPPE